MIGKRISHYLVKRELGRGGMGVVYLATDTRLDREVALKFLPPHLSSDPVARARFIQEAKAASALNHPSVCSVHDIGESEDGQGFLVMPFYPGQTIEQLVADGPMSVAQTRAVGQRIAEGLGAAHDAGIVHRDIKAANVIVGEDGRVSILDFGVAKFGTGVDLTKDGSTVGTTAYMSPEQARGEEATTQSDLWSLGVLLHEMLSGARPFAGGYDAAVAYAIVNADPPPLPSSLPEDLRRLVDALLAKSPGERPEAAQVVEALTLAETPPSPPESIVTPMMARVTGAILLVAVGAFLWTHFGRSVEPEDTLDAIAVFPFDIQAESELAYLGRGMVSLIGPMLDGLPGTRAVDHKSLLGLLEQGADPFLDPEEAREIAESFGAGRYVLGSLARLGSGLQLTTSLYGLKGELLVEDIRTLASEEDLLSAAGSAVQVLIPELIDLSDGELTETVLGSTDSFPAMKAYLLAEAAYSAGQFQSARDLGEEALGHDSTFAAAWYLTGNAFAQDFLDTRPFREGALRHIEGAPRRLRKLIEARAGTGAENFAAMQAILAQYPNELDAMKYVADQTYHRNPLFGKPASAATPLFQAVLRVDPDNGEYLAHLAGLLYRDRHFEALDSLFRSLPEAGKSQQAEFVEIVFAMHGNRNAAIDSAAAGPGWFLATFALLLSDDVASAQSVLQEALQRQAGPTLPAWASNTPGFGSLEDMSHWISAIRGQRRDLFERTSLIANDTPDESALRQVFTSLSLPFLPSQADSLMQAAQGLRAEQVDAWLESNTLLLGAADHRYAGDVRDFQIYARAMVADRLGAAGSLRKDWAELAAADSAEIVTRNLVRDLEARVLFRDGKLEEALSVLHEVETDIGNQAFAASLLHNGALTRLLRARILFELGRFEEAIGWSQSVNDGFHFRVLPSLLPITYRLEAEAYVRLGDWDNAIERYQRFIELWEDADEDLQPQVEEARRRMDQALQRKLAEPAA
jgi:tetratricopeptide (TPR) repeat protein/predicted Ser/Thr protein kinase